MYLLDGHRSQSIEIEQLVLQSPHRLGPTERERSPLRRLHLEFAPGLGGRYRALPLRFRDSAVPDALDLGQDLPLDAGEIVGFELCGHGEDARRLQRAISRRDGV